MGLFGGFMRALGGVSRVARTSARVGGAVRTVASAAGLRSRTLNRVTSVAGAAGRAVPQRRAAPRRSGGSSGGVLV